MGPSAQVQCSEQTTPSSETKHGSENQQTKSKRPEGKVNAHFCLDPTVAGQRRQKTEHVRLPDRAHQ